MEGRHIPFTSEDRERIAGAARWGMVVGITNVVATALQVMYGLHGARGALAFALVAVYAMPIVFNVYLIRASGALRRVAQTYPTNQHDLLHGFRGLRVYFLIQVVMIIVSIGLLLFGAVGAAAL